MCLQLCTPGQGDSNKWPQTYNKNKKVSMFTQSLNESKQKCKSFDCLLNESKIARLSAIFKITEYQLKKIKQECTKWELAS